MNNNRFFQVNDNITSTKFTFNVLVHNTNTKKETYKEVAVFIRPQRGENINTATNEIENRLGRYEKPLIFEKIKEEHFTNK